MQALSSQELMRICEAYFLTADELAAASDGQKRDRSYTRYVAAYNELWNRGVEVREWARQLLTHADFDAREAGAGLLGHLAERGLLGEAEEPIVAELGLLIQRPTEEDPKEMQAVDAALSALSTIGSPQGIPYLGWILNSTLPEHQDDTQWTAAEALADLTGESFMTSDDPVEAAREWLRAHPTG